MRLSASRPPTCYIAQPRAMGARHSEMPADPLWFKTAVIYQAHVRTFFDSNGDGVGDFAGLTSKLDYIEELGATAIWLLPFYPSPLRDGGYDIADYFTINPAYGTLDDFRAYVAEAHARGMRVITELVLNHTSDQHAWFQAARRAQPGSDARQMYVWSDTPNKYEGVRIIFKDVEPSNWTWDDEAGAYYWHRFYSHQPDLNWENPIVREKMFEIVDFWFDLGVDGLRLDAVPYLIQKEGTLCESLPETHAVLKDLRRHIDERHSDKMLLAEANMWPRDSAAYFGDADECHMTFHFPLMPRLYIALARSDATAIAETLADTPSIPEPCQWAVFLRNHDELSLEMVNEEERSLLWDHYAADPRARINLGIRRRLAPLFGGDVRRIALLNALMFSVRGTPIIYYGDEIGMGDDLDLDDRDGVRTPMQWDASPNAGFSKAPAEALTFPIVFRLALSAGGRERTGSTSARGFAFFVGQTASWRSKSDTRCLAWGRSRSSNTTIPRCWPSYAVSKRRLS